VARCPFAFAHATGDPALSEDSGLVNQKGQKRVAEMQSAMVEPEESQRRFATRIEGRHSEERLVKSGVEINSLENLEVAIAATEQ
jgi:hypothetical protein